MYFYFGLWLILYYCSVCCRIVFHLRLFAIWNPTFVHSYLHSSVYSISNSLCVSIQFGECYLDWLSGTPKVIYWVKSVETNWLSLWTILVFKFWILFVKLVYYFPIHVFPLPIWYLRFTLNHFWSIFTFGCYRFIFLFYLLYHSVSPGFTINRYNPFVWLGFSSKTPWVFWSVNFTNILLAAFLYESFLCSFNVLTICVCNIFGKTILTQKLLIKCCWNWHLVSQASYHSLIYWCAQGIWNTLMWLVQKWITKCCVSDCILKLIL